YEQISPGTFEAYALCLISLCEYKTIISTITTDEFIIHLGNLIDEGFNEMEIESRKLVLEVVIQLCVTCETIMDKVNFASKALSLLRCENDHKLLSLAANLISIYGKHFKATEEDVILLIAIMKSYDKNLSKNAMLAASSILQNNPNL